MEEKSTLNPKYFKEVYDANDDPWNFETSAYEAEKYASTIDALPRNDYDNALEIGCSIGVLTKMLAENCKHLLAIDVSEKALQKAAERCKDLDHVQFEKSSFPQELPNDRYDLIMISEVAYYLSPSDWKMAMEKLVHLMKPGATVVLVHWLPEVHDYPQTGDQVHNSFEEQLGGVMKNIHSSRREKYRIDIWENLA